jgi:hypothetical protein
VREIIIWPSGRGPVGKGALWRIGSTDFYLISYLFNLIYIALKYTLASWQHRHKTPNAATRGVKGEGNPTSCRPKGVAANQGVW